MKRAISQRPAARFDLLEQFDYFEAEAGVELAERYFAAVEATFALLVVHPEIGSRYPYKNFVDLRRITVSGFESYLVFYVVLDSVVDVVRVLHGARDIVSILQDYE